MELAIRFFVRRAVSQRPAGLPRERPPLPFGYGGGHPCKLEAIVVPAARRAVSVKLASVQIAFSVIARSAARRPVGTYRPQICPLAAFSALAGGLPPRPSTVDFARAVVVVAGKGRANQWRPRKGALRALTLSRTAALFDAYRQPLLELRASR